MPDESFDFLGYTFGRCFTPGSGRPYIGARPARKKVLRLCREISEQTRARWSLLETEELVGRLNRRLRGWANYFCLGTVSRAYRVVNYHAERRLRQWLCRKHKVSSQGTTRFPLRYILDTLRLYELRRRRQNFPCASA